MSPDPRGYHRGDERKKKNAKNKKKGSPPSVRKLALVDPDLLKELLKNDDNYTKRRRRPSSTKGKSRISSRGMNNTKKKKKKKKKKTKNKKQRQKDIEEVQQDPFLPGGVLSDPRVDRIAALRRALDDVLSKPGPSRAKKVTGPGPTPDQEARRNEATKLLTQLTAARQRLRQSEPGYPMAVPPSDYGQEEEEEEEEAVDDDNNRLVEPVAKVLPRGVPDRAKALLNIIAKSPGGRLGWDKASHQLTVRGVPVQGSNILDLVTHVTRERLPRSKKSQNSPGPPPGFDSFARGLQELNIPRELIRNQRRWTEIYRATAAHGRRRKLVTEEPTTPRSSKSGSNSPFREWARLS